VGNVERCDKTLPTNEMIYHVRKSAVLRERWTTDLEGVAREFGLSQAELDAIRDKDVRRMRDLGVHQYYIPQILRLFFGSSNNSNASAALECYKRAFPDEFAKSAALQAEHARRLGSGADATTTRPTAGRDGAPGSRP
jgi:Aromatic-ring-opening dioxygenase LigAB, LigA subunit